MLQLGDQKKNVIDSEIQRVKKEITDHRSEIFEKLKMMLIER
jgi:hypothetical protein